MNKLLLIFFVVVFCSKIFGQVTYEKGYILNKENETVECFIKNVGWKNNPKHVDYKLGENAKVLKGTVNEIVAFGIEEKFKYQRAVVLIDTSKFTTANYPDVEKPQYRKDTLFLKVLVEGDGSLYYSQNVLGRRFFYRIGNNPITQLVYKEYQKDNKILKNDLYKRQLIDSVKCASSDIAKYVNLSYTQKALEKLFIDYNSCSGSEYVLYKNKSIRDFFKLSLRPGIQRSSLVLKNIGLPNEVDFGYSTSFRMGIEAELVLPFNKNKWSVICEPYYQSYKKEDTSNSALELSINYSSINIPVGLRYSIFLGEDYKLYANGLLHVFDLGINKALDEPITRDINSRVIGFGFGTGIKYSEKIMLEFRYNPPREILSKQLNADAAYATTSIVLGYTFLSVKK